MRSSFDVLIILWAIIVAKELFWFKKHNNDLHANSRGIIFLVLFQNVL